MTDYDKLFHRRELDDYDKWLLSQGDPEEDAKHEAYLREQSGVDFYRDGKYDLDDDGLARERV